MLSSLPKRRNSSGPFDSFAALSPQGKLHSNPSVRSVPLDCARGFGKTRQALTPLRLRQNAIENPRITREMVDEAASELGKPHTWNVGLY
jgi:hypothetical protein